MRTSRNPSSRHWASRAVILRSGFTFKLAAWTTTSDQQENMVCLFPSRNFYFKENASLRTAKIYGTWVPHWCSSTIQPASINSQWVKESKGNSLSGVIYKSPFWPSLFLSCTAIHPWPRRGGEKGLLMLPKLQTPQKKWSFHLKPIISVFWWSSDATSHLYQ